jgi:hypothetical protein
LKEAFDQFQTQLHKEKEMVDFRRFTLALVVLALFAGMASAQVGGGGTGTPLSCQTNVTVTPNLRGEGFTEQTGDVTLTCTGGTPQGNGTTIPLVNITVFYNTTVTSRLLPTTLSSAISEALLLVDEPGSGLPGYGPSLPQILCATALTGCPVVANVTTTGGPGGTGSSPFQTPQVMTVSGTTTTYTQGPNVFQGIVSGNSVTFFGVPALPPTSSGSRVYRITNVRVNAVPLSGSSSSGAQPVVASVSISGATSLSLTQSSLNVGFVTPSLNASVSGAKLTFAQCSGVSASSSGSTGLLSFTELFGTAFKTRVAAQANTPYAGQSNSPGYTDLTTGSVVTPNQNTPGAIYNSESNFVYPIGSTGQVAGLADYGTRLKAIFNNIPTGVSVWVSTTNVNNAAAPVTAPAVPGGTSTATYAQLVNGETTNDGNASVAGFFPSVSGTSNYSPSSSQATPIAQIPITNGTGTAVWEIVNTNPNATETALFGVYLTYTANVAQNSPPIGVSTVNLSYAATATSGAASSTLTIPRFAADSTAARNLAGINLCRTILLYPYITNQSGFDTGLTVANTSMDSFTTGSSVTSAETGSCTFTWYGGTTTAPTTPPPATNTGTIAPGTVWAGLSSVLTPGYQGYAFAICNFRWAHGFAFISDLGARNLAMGYLAVVLNDPGTGTRSNTNTTTSENGAH